MPPTGTFSNEETVKAWAEITLKIWRDKIIVLKLWRTGDLYNSLKNTLFVAAGNDVQKIEFSFKLYGIFVDILLGRNRKEWYSRVFYREVMRLREILVEKYGEDVVREVIYAMKMHS